MPKLLLVFLVSIAVSLVLVSLARVTRKRHRMRGTEDVETTYVTSICTLYGIFIAFMIFTVWSRYDQAETGITVEANNVARMYRLAAALPDPLRADVQKLSLQYARSVIDDEWDAMLHGQASPRTERLVQRSWRLGNRLEGTNDSVVRDHILTAWATATDQRRMRLLWSHSGLSDYAYAVLFVGALITVGLSSLFTVEDFRTHIVKAASLAAIIGLMLATVWALGHPFGGALRLEPLEFKQVIQMLSSEP